MGPSKEHKDRNTELTTENTEGEGAGGANEELRMRENNHREHRGREEETTGFTDEHGLGRDSRRLTFRVFMVSRVCGLKR